MPKLGRRSEGTEIQYQSSATPLRDAPWGTEYTPALKDVIIGGRYHSVLERPYGQHFPKYEKMAFLSDKPNYVDPRTLSDFSRRYNKPYQDPFHKSQVVGRPTNAVSRRPDSKDIASRFGVLPPIDEHRLKNHVVSTVFEPEPWTKQFRPENKENLYKRPHEGAETDRTNGYRPLYDPRGSGTYGGSRLADYDAGRLDYDAGRENGLRHSYDSSPLRQTERRLTNDEFVKQLQGKIPGSVFLPTHPLQLSEDEEVRLLEVIGDALRGVSPLKLRDVYLDIANTSDKTLSSFCQYQDLYLSLNRQMMFLPGDVLQVTAALFVSPDRQLRDVNYEKFLSFIGLALKHREDFRQTNQGLRPRTPVEQQVDNYFADSEMAKLVSTVQQQLDSNDFLIDFSRLTSELSVCDRMGKGVLDLRAIVDVCYQMNIPLQHSVLNRCLQKCRLNSYDDRYSWRKFVDILRKAQPSKPSSESVRVGQQSYRASPPPAQEPRYSPPPPNHSKPVTPLYRRNDPPFDPRESKHVDGDEYQREEVLSRMENDVRQLERNYEEIKQKLRNKDETPWFTNFMDFANGLYKLDYNYDGDLPAEDVFRWTKMYNETGNLGISDHMISKALSDSCKSGKVNIHTYLMKLGNVANHDKIV